MDFDSFTDGVAPGGIYDKGEIKLLVCYLMKKIETALDRTTINEILQQYSVANYFEVNQALTELASSGSLLTWMENGEEMFELSPAAIYSVNEIEKSLPRSVREKVVSAAMKILTARRIKQESKVDVEPLENGYNVTFTIVDVNTVLLKLTIYVSQESQIELVKRNFYSNAVEIYSNIISALTVE